MKRLLLLAFVSVTLACSSDKSAPAAAPETKTTVALAPTATSSGKHVLAAGAKLISRFEGVLAPGVEYRAVVALAKGGEFEIVFFPEVAPNHVANFVSLARKGFYDGTTFHRVLEGFMAQGGDPTGSGSGGPGYEIPAEFSSLPHKRGTLSMARTQDPNSAGSQFFICFARAAMLDNDYTVFGEVIRGMDVVDGIRRRDPEKYPSFAGDAIREVTISEIR